MCISLLDLINLSSIFFCRKKIRINCNNYKDNRYYTLNKLSKTCNLLPMIVQLYPPTLFLICGFILNKFNVLFIFLYGKKYRCSITSLIFS